MLNDRDASELISKSLFGSLSSAEEAELQDRLSGDDRSREYARLSQVIQDSVVEMGHDVESSELLPDLDMRQHHHKEQRRARAKDTCG